MRVNVNGSRSIYATTPPRGRCIGSKRHRKLSLGVSHRRAGDRGNVPVYICVINRMGVAPSSSLPSLRIA
ncbi:MAG: hypothetical protein V3Q69_08615 [Burkholderia sp.]